jgi:hypothetical protein
MARSPLLARRLFDRFEPVHALTYFTPEARAAFDAAGYRGFWMGYFAGRAAPLGEVPADVVAAIFYNFSTEHVHRALPAAWSFAPPAAALDARVASARTALHRCGITDSDDVRTAADLLERAARSADWAGRPLFAANLALPWPEGPVDRLWHAATLLREQRGDAHVALLVAEGIGGRDCNVLHSAADRVPREFLELSRRYDDAEWQTCTRRLVERGLLDAAGELTDAGAAFKRRIEGRTDELALPVFDVLDDEAVTTLFRVLTPITRAVVAAGDIPVATPMGLRRDDLDDDSAHLAAG